MSAFLRKRSGSALLHNLPLGKTFCRRETGEKRKYDRSEKNILQHFKIPPFNTPPRSAELDVSLESNNGEEDQEMLDDLEHKELDQ